VEKVTNSRADQLYVAAEEHFPEWEVVKDLVDEMIDLMLNYRQSGHPGGSRSKVHILLSAMLSGAMRWDVLRPWRRFNDRFVLSAGHTVPLVYACLAVLNEAMRARHELDGDESFAFPDGGRYALTWEDLLMLRKNGGLSGHAEMEGKTLFLKWNTGPSGHGMPSAAGEALALKMAGCEEVKVFALEGEGGLTPGASHETRNTAWGLGLSNLVFLIDWNDYGIDDNAISSVVHGTPTDWFEPAGWRTCGTEEGSEWGPVAREVLQAARGDNPSKLPTMAWFKTRKGRGYLKYDNKSHGAAHPMNSEPFWELRKKFMEKYGVEYRGVDQPAPDDPEERQAQAAYNLELAISVLRGKEDLVRYVSNRLLEISRSIPEEIPSFNLGGKGADLFNDERLYDFRNYPESIWAKPGESQPNRAALGRWGSWVNSFAQKEYGRPLVIASSADLADSTNISGFAKEFDGGAGVNWYQRDDNPRGTLLPQEITEFCNAGVSVGLASVNLAEDPLHSFDGFWGACSTYGSFSYLKYGPMRLFSQLAQDCDLPVGKVIWIAGHSGPETAEDSRTHFGIFAPGVTQLFPEGHVIDLHPWEYNEVPVVLAAALRLDVPIVALHLTRPKVKIPDREALGMPSHFEAARGAYVMRPFRDDQPRMGTVFVQGTCTTDNLVGILPELDKAGLNVKVVAAISPQLFRLQDASYREQVASVADRWDAMVISNRSKRVTRDWIAHPIVEEYSLTSDWDDRWRTGGSLEEVIAESHLSKEHILSGIERFVRDRESRLGTLRDAVESATRHDG
jgi:transketolase